MKCLVALAFTMMTMLMSSLVIAQEYPLRPIRVVIPWPPGQATDLAARVVGQKLTEVFGYTMVMDNRPGAGGQIGTDIVAKASADGYTLLAASSGPVTVAPLLQKTPYVSQRDLVPVAISGIAPYILVALPSFPAKDIKDFLTVIKASPGKYTYGSWGVGSSGHLIMEWLKKQTGMQIGHVPYRQVPQLLTELAAGGLQIGWADPSSPVSFIESGKVRGIAISGTAHVPRTASIATMGEQGYPFESVGWFGVFAPPGTPAAIVQRLTAEINKIQKLPESADKMTALNFEPPPVKTAEQFGAIVAADLQTWKKLVVDAGITPED